MGWIQDTIWNNIFKYSYPISFAGAVFYGILAVLQLDISSIVTNKNWLLVFNIFIGICGILSVASWYGTDLSVLQPVSGLIDMNLNKTRDIIGVQASGKTK